MDFSQDVAIKYSAFTLCYRTLLTHLDDLDRALRRDSHDLKRRIISQADSALKEQVYQSRPRNLDDAIRALALRLHSVRVSVETINPDAAKVIEDIVTDIEQKTSDWQYQSEVERHREWGERLSRLFYDGTRWSKTRERLAADTKVMFRYVGILDKAVQGQNTFGNRVAPMAFYPTYPYANADEPESNVILVRFSFEHNFSTYLAYPFFFFHEFASHVHSANSDSDIFDDGWMMYAIHDFLISNVYKLPPTYRLHQAQVQAIGEHCPGKISTGFLRRYYFFGQNLHKWSDPWAPGFFKRLTRELAGYPLTRKNPRFLADFVESLAYHFEERPDDLKRKIKEYSIVDDLSEYSIVDDLFMRLPPP